MEKGVTFFDGKKNVKIQTIFQASLMDRPERSAATGFGNHGGANTVRWGYVGKVGDCFASCSNCYKRRKLNPEPSPENSECENGCVDWETEEMIFDAPQYPQEMLPEGIRKDGYLQNKKTSFGEMKQAALTGARKLHEKDWSKLKTENYLKQNGWNGPCLKKIVDHAVQNITNLNVESVLPAKFAFGKELERCIDAIMHLLFLGCTKTVGKLLKKLFVSCGKYSKFHKDCSDFLRQLRNLKLEWCKAWNLGSNEKPFGPYVSENCMAYARVLKSIYSTISMIKNASQKRKELLDKGMVLISSWIALVSRLMQREVTEELVVDTERHVKIFLSALHDVDTTLLGWNSEGENCNDSDEEEEKDKKRNL